MGNNITYVDVMPFVIETMKGLRGPVWQQVVLQSCKAYPKHRNTKQSSALFQITASLCEELPIINEERLF